MDKLAKLTSFLHDGEERDWFFKYKTKEITDHLDYMRSMWDDNASRTIWYSFVTPFRNTSSDLLSSKEKALEKYINIRSVAGLLFKSHIKVHGLSEEIGDLLRESDKAQKYSDHSIVEGTDLMNKVTYDAPIVDEGYQEWCDEEAQFREIYAKRCGIY